MVQENWLLILSAGVLYCEIRNLRESIENLSRSIDNLSENNFTRKRSRTLSIASSKDDWFSIKSEASVESLNYSDDSNAQTVIEQPISENPQNDEFLKLVDEKHYGSDSGIAEAWQMIKEKDNNDTQILIRKTRAQCSMYGQHRKNGPLGENYEKRKEFATRALEFADEIIKRAPRASVGHRYKAAALGCNMEFLGVTEKAEKGKIIKDCLTEALVCDPDDLKAHYILARWHFEASNLPWALRGVASRMGMPPASEEEALFHFDKSLGGSGHDKEVQLYRFKLLNKLRKFEEAKKAVENGLALPIVFNSDQPVHEELIKIQNSF
ncbi:unnamed protein product [Oikopleura dioica]|uniref:Regulator of microtubule dynamics protein 1 n=1 Tax=Oikopleura dioica TaxID=34765 RepID=E4XCQ3_OIKDI|nr:unnamed protein product [Oikopleura dioica]